MCLPERTKEALRIQAAYSGVSLEQYLRDLLNRVSQVDERQERKIMEVAAQYFSENAIEELRLETRRSNRKNVNFDK